MTGKVGHVGDLVLPHGFDGFCFENTLAGDRGLAVVEERREDLDVFCWFAEAACAAAVEEAILFFFGFGEEGFAEDVISAEIWVS